MIVAVRDFITGLVNSFLTFIRMFFFTRPVKSTAKISVNKECVILGNGPSLSESISGYGNLFENKDIYCVNNFALSAQFTEIKPRFYVLAGPEYWMDNVSDLYINMRKELFETIVQKTSWPMSILIPVRSRGKKIISELKTKNSNISVVYFNTCPVEGLKPLSHMFFSLGVGMPRPHNVLIPALMLSIRNRYKNVYLFGADHTWLDKITVNDNNEAMLVHKHFYDPDNKTPQKMQMLGKGTRKLYEMLHKFMVTFHAYVIIEEYAKSKNVQVVNCTPGSMIDAFKRGKIS